MFLHVTPGGLRVGTCRIAAHALRNVHLRVPPVVVDAGKSVCCGAQHYKQMPCATLPTVQHNRHEAVVLTAHPLCELRMDGAPVCGPAPPGALHTHDEVAVGACDIVAQRTGPRCPADSAPP